MADHGEAIARRFHQTGDTERIKAEWREWKPAVEAFLSEKIGPTYAAQFRNARIRDIGFHGRNDEGCGYYSDAKSRSEVLIDIASELRRSSQR